MGFMRSLYAGVSGLKNHQIMMDVTGNNISNVNTAGFKSGRVVFSETFAQTLRGTTAPIANVGGTNPMQIGLGSSLQQIDTLFAQGNIETTGQITDMAIQGDGFFVVKQGDSRYYTRNGAHQFDADGSLINPGNGAIIQGMMADEAGVIPVDAKIEDIILPYGQKSKARATTAIGYTGNLNAAEQPLGTILDTEKLYAIDDGTSDVNNMFVSNTHAPVNGNDTRNITAMITESTTVTVTIDDNVGGVIQRKFTYNSTDNSNNNGSFNTINDLIAEFNNYFTGLGRTDTLALNANGELVTSGLLATEDFSIESTNPSFNLALSTLNKKIADTSTGETSDYRFHHIAKSDDLLTTLVNKLGEPLGHAVGDTITIAGKVGGTDIEDPGNPGNPPTYSVIATSTYQNFVDSVETALNITNENGVFIDTDGSMKFEGDGGLVKELSELNITSDNAAATVFNGLYDSGTGNYVIKQYATDIEHAASISTYDSLGNEHVLSIKFKKNVDIPNEWIWEASVTEPAIVIGGGTGRVTFDLEGKLASFEYDAGASNLQIDPGLGNANVINTSLDFGELGGINGLTQFARTSNAVASAQDGFTMGVLERLNIERTGVITGTFTNGVSQTMARIVLATFNNPGGLLRAKDGMYSTTANSGTPIIGLPQESVRAEIIAGALEQSNVDLTEEFTRLIIAQRGFQAASKVITTSDDLLQEINNLKR